MIGEQLELDEAKFAGWIAFYNKDKLEIKKSEADGLYDAKLLAIKHFKVPKSKQGLLAIEPAYEEFKVNEAQKKDAVGRKSIKDRMKDQDKVMGILKGKKKPYKEEAPANKTGVNVVGTGDDPTVWKRKKKKVKTEQFGGNVVFIVSGQRFHDSRLGKARYARYEKYVGNDDVGEAIRLYGRTNPKLPIILKNSENGAMLYLKYGNKR